MNRSLFVIRFENGTYYGSTGDFYGAEVYRDRSAVAGMIAHSVSKYKKWKAENGHTGLLERWRGAKAVECKLSLEDDEDKTKSSSRM